MSEQPIEVSYDDGGIVLYGPNGDAPARFSIEVVLDHRAIDEHGNECLYFTIVGTSEQFIIVLPKDETK